jgi:hypothetical protein
LIKGASCEAPPGDKQEFSDLVAPNKCASFAEICRRAGGRRAYNSRRARSRAARITRILELQDRGVRLTGRGWAALFGVHEATASRDLAFVRRLREQFGRMVGRAEFEMRAANFVWGRGARSYSLTFEMRGGRRIR